MKEGSAGTAISDEPLVARLSKIVTTNAVSPFGVPGAIFAVWREGGAPRVVAAGVDAEGRTIEPDDLFPLTSASKLATGLAILRLVEEGALWLDAPIGAYLPDAAAAQWPEVTVRSLLSHTSGLPLEVPHDLSDPPGKVRYGPGLRWPGPLARACLEARPLQAPGSGVQYSNIGYGLLALAAERVTGRGLSALLAGLVIEPLGIEAYVDTLPERPVIKVSKVSSPYAGGAIEPINSETWRLLGTPWAGLTCTASGLLKLVQAYGPGSQLLRPETALAARSDQTAGLSGGFGTREPFLGHLPSNSITWSPCPWGLGVELQGGKEPHWALADAPSSFGQVGSSGCLAWFDPEKAVAWAVLGARASESGWLLRHGARLAQAAYAAAGV